MAQANEVDADFFCRCSRSVCLISKGHDEADEGKEGEERAEEPRWRCEDLFYLHSLHANIHNTNTQTFNHRGISSLLSNLARRGYITPFFIPLLYSSTSARCHPLGIIAPLPSCRRLFAWNVICRCNRGRNWVQQMCWKARAAYQAEPAEADKTLVFSLPPFNVWRLSTESRRRRVALSFRLEWGKLRPACLAWIPRRNGLVWLAFSSRACASAARVFFFFSSAGVKRVGCLSHRTLPAPVKSNGSWLQWLHKIWN